MKRSATGEEWEGAAKKRGKGEEEEEEWEELDPCRRLVAGLCYLGQWKGYRDFAPLLLEYVRLWAPCLYCRRPGPHELRCRFGPVCASCYTSHCTPQALCWVEFIPGSRRICHNCELPLRGAVAWLLCPSCARGAPLDIAGKQECAQCKKRIFRACEVSYSCVPCSVGYFGVLLDKAKRRACLGSIGLHENRRLTFKRYMLAYCSSSGRVEGVKWETVDKLLFDGSDWEH